MDSVYGITLLAMTFVGGFCAWALADPSTRRPLVFGLLTGAVATLACVAIIHRALVRKKERAEAMAIQSPYTGFSTTHFPHLERYRQLSRGEITIREYAQSEQHRGQGQ